MKDHSASSRRKFLATTGMITAGAMLPSFAQMKNLGFKPRRFKLCLNPGNIGVKADQEELLYMAVEYSYEAISPLLDDLKPMSDKQLKDLRKKMKQHKISWGSAGLPVQFREDERRFQDDLAQLPDAAKALERAGVTRMNTWVLNGNNELTYLANFKQHSERLRACARVLGDHGIRLGLEYVSPKTLMNRFKYPFVRTMAEARELIAEIGADNVGLVLDSFHWYCAGDTKEDILALDKKDIITCDLNDARQDLTRDTQIDGTRELPMATGKIDLKPFLEALVAIGYDGPVRSEPFNKALNEMDNAAALKANYAAMRKAFDLVD